jgi:carotenoid cleavage dioxygenase
MLWSPLVWFINACFARLDPPPKDNPYLRGILGPVDEEKVLTKLKVEGVIPKDMNGAYLRNGPNPMVEPKGWYHWFDVSEL